MFCGYCGKRLQENEHFCGNCGKKVEAPGEKDVEVACGMKEEIQEKTEVQAEKETRKPKAKRIKKIVFGIIGVAIVAAIVWYGVFYFSMCAKLPKEQPHDEEDLHRMEDVEYMVRQRVEEDYMTMYAGEFTMEHYYGDDDVLLGTIKYDDRGRLFEAWYYDEFGNLKLHFSMDGWLEDDWLQRKFDDYFIYEYDKDGNVKTMIDYYEFGSGFTRYYYHADGTVKAEFRFSEENFFPEKMLFYKASEKKDATEVRKDQYDLSGRRWTVLSEGKYKREGDYEIRVDSHVGLGVVYDTVEVIECE